MPRTPLGVTVLGVFALMTGVSQAFIGLLLMGVVAFGEVPTGDGVFIAGVFALVVAAIYFMVGLAAFSLKPWAYGFALFMSLFGLFEGLLVLLATGSLVYGLATLLFPLVVYMYLQSDEVKSAFVAAATARAGRDG